MGKSKDEVLVIDIEACCWRGNPPRGMYKEIIEIGIATVDYRTKEVRRSDTIFVKPAFSEISPFCTKITSLTKEFLDKNGVPFKKACQILQDRYYSKKRMWFGWDDFDRTSFVSNCDIHKVDYPFGKHFYNLRNLYAFQNSSTQERGVSEALHELGLTFEGNPHSGKDDAYNTARILSTMYKQQQLLSKRSVPVS